MTQVAEGKGVKMSNPGRMVELPGESRPWLDAVRQAGIDRFNTVGFPTTRQEEWRLTNVAPIAKTKFVPASGIVTDSALAMIEDSNLGSGAAAELFFVNGHYLPQHSRIGKLPRGASVRSLANAIAVDPALLEPHLGKVADISANPFVAWNTGSFRDGAVIHLARGVVLDGPIHLLFVTTAESEPVVSHPRVLVVAEDGAQLTLVKSFVGDNGVHLTNVVAEVIAGNDCLINHNRLQRGNDRGYAVSTLAATLGRNSELISHAATLGGKFTRNDINVIMQGEGAHATLNGLVILTADQFCDNHTLLDHAVPNCPSHELYKHILDGKAIGVFRGKILVRPDAQKTDSKQTSKSLLLSDDAIMHSQPALEIYADDVKCTHGSTIGPVDEDMVFYLRTRGVGADAARHLLSYAFAADVTRRIKIELFRRRLEDFLAAQHGLPRDLRITDLGQHDEKAR
jgi:Fe-S cluster assembly protein SufD